MLGGTSQGFTVKRSRGRPKMSYVEAAARIHKVLSAQQGLHGANQSKWRPLLQVCREVETELRNSGGIAPRKPSDGATRPGEALRKAVKREQARARKLQRLVDDELLKAGWTEERRQAGVVTDGETTRMTPEWDAAYSLALGRAFVRWAEGEGFEIAIDERDGRKIPSIR